MTVIRSHFSEPDGKCSSMCSRGCERAPLDWEKNVNSKCEALSHILHFLSFFHNWLLCFSAFSSIVQPWQLCNETDDRKVNNLFFIVHFFAVQDEKSHNEQPKNTTHSKLKKKSSPTFFKPSRFFTLFTYHNQMK